MKTLFFDVETSGTDDKKNGILQLVGEVELDEVVKESFDYKMKVFPGQIIEDGELEANGFTYEQIEGFDDPFKCFLKFTKMLNKYVDRFERTDRFTLVGYNSRFDDGFLREWFLNCHEKYYGAYFYWPAIDVSNIVAVKYRKVRSQFLNFKLMTVAKTLKIEVDESKAHDAVYKTAVTKAIYQKCFGC